MDKYTLIFEGPQSGDADTLRKLKGAFLAELNFSVEETINALSNCPLTVRESEDQSSLEDLLAVLIAAGANARIEEPIGKSSASESSNETSVKASPVETFVFELEGAEFQPPPANVPSLPPTTEVPTLSTAQSTLLSLESDFEKTSSPESAPEVPEVTQPQPSTQQSLDAFTLELSELDPEPQPKSDPLPTEHELEIHFETEGEAPSEIPPIESVAKQDALPPVAAAAAIQPGESDTAPTTPLVSAASTATANPTSTPLIPNFTPQSAAGTTISASAADSTPVTSAITPNVEAFGAKRRQKSKLHPKLIEFILSVIIPIVILVLGNFVFFFVFDDQKVAPPPPLSLDKVLDDEDAEAANRMKSESSSTTPSAYHGVTVAGDFRVEWKVTTRAEEILSVNIKIIPPAPPELSAKQIVAGKKPPLKVTAIELDDLPLTKVGRLAASIVGPARVAMQDESRALRAVANAQFSVELNPETKTLSGQISLKTEAATESPLRWVAERGENSRPKIKLDLNF